MWSTGSAFDPLLLGVKKTRETLTDIHEILCSGTRRAHEAVFLHAMRHPVCHFEFGVALFLHSALIKNRSPAGERN